MTPAILTKPESFDSGFMFCVYGKTNPETFALVYSLISMGVPSRRKTDDSENRLLV